MRVINKLIVHCTATPEGRVTTVADVDLWHRQKGWTGIGYHYLIGLNGEIWEGRREALTGAHTLKHNADSIGVCYVGGCDSDMKTKDTRTPAQKQSLIKLLTDLKKKYPKAEIKGHRDYNSTSCPGFDAYQEYRNI